MQNGLMYVREALRTKTSVFFFNTVQVAFDPPSFWKIMLQIIQEDCWKSVQMWKKCPIYPEILGHSCKKCIVILD